MCVGLVAARQGSTVFFLQYAIWQLVDAMSTPPVQMVREVQKSPVDALNLAISFCFAKSTEEKKSGILYEESTDEIKHQHRFVRQILQYLRLHSIRL